MLKKLFPRSLLYVSFSLFFLAIFLIFPLNFAKADTCYCYCRDAQGAYTTGGGPYDCSLCSSYCVSPCSCSQQSTPPNQTPSTSGAPVTLDNPLPDVGTPQVLIGKVISAALGLVGSLALAMFIFGGFLWMTAMGNADKVKKGRETMIWAALGLVIIFTAYALITFVLTNVLGAK
jgi:hypothetical protein